MGKMFRQSKSNMYLGMLLQYTGEFFSLGIGAEAAVSIIELWGLKGLECAPKTGRKLLLGNKSTVMVIVMSQAGGLQKEKNLDLVI